MRVCARSVDLGACVCVVHWQVEVTHGTVVVLRTFYKKSYESYVRDMKFSFGRRGGFVIT